MKQEHVVKLSTGLVGLVVAAASGVFLFSGSAVSTSFTSSVSGHWTTSGAKPAVVNGPKGTAGNRNGKANGSGNNGDSTANGNASGNSATGNSPANGNGAGNGASAGDPGSLARGGPSVDCVTGQLVLNGSDASASSVTVTYANTGDSPEPAALQISRVTYTGDVYPASLRVAGDFANTDGAGLALAPPSMTYELGDVAPHSTTTGTISLTSAPADFGDALTATYTISGASCSS